MENIINLLKKRDEIGIKLKEARLQFAELRDIESFNNYQKTRQEYRDVDFYGEIYSFDLMNILFALCSEQPVILFETKDDCLYSYLDKNGMPVITLNKPKKFTK